MIYVFLIVIGIALIYYGKSEKRKLKELKNEVNYSIYDLEIQAGTFILMGLILIISSIIRLIILLFK